jgi:dihydrolipoamide dehydrogenase
MVKMGVAVFTGRKLEKIEEKAGGLALIMDGGQAVEADKALLSIGRVPDLEGLGEIELARNSRGGIQVNDRMETSAEGIYAPGDINGRLMLAHAAFKMGEVAAVNAMGGDEKANLKYVPSVFTPCLKSARWV